MPEQSVFAAELSWPDYDARVRNGGTPMLLPIGSMEQHGHHMPMNVDVLLPVEFARRVAGRIGALVAPPFTYGYKSHQKSGGGNHLPGTTSLDGATLVAALRELRWSGIDDMKIVVLSYWDFVDKDTIARLYPKGFPGWDIEHGGVLETSLMLALHPGQVRLERAIDHAPASFPPYDVYPPKPEWTPASGTLSSPREASAEKGEILLQVCTDGIVKALEAEFPR